MELEFRENTLNCLKRAVWGVKNDEQTLEIKLPDAMPDIGKVLGVRGQTLLRGKEWRNGSIGVSGGVMVWVLYAPEEEGTPKTVEGWIPFSFRWDLAENCRDGNILADLRLESIDGRSVSARKLLVRATVSAAVEALTPEKIKLYCPEAPPEDVQLLRQSYPVQLTAESGERAFELEEVLPLPEKCSGAQKLLYSNLQPGISECKLLGDKLVFRGVAQLRLLLRREDGSLCSCDFSIPFSQYGELEQAYDETAEGYVLPAVTSCEVELEGDVRLKAGLLGQYAVSREAEAELLADAYSTRRSLELQLEEVVLPTVLDRCSCPIAVAQPLPEGRCCDLFVTAGHPRQSRKAEGVELLLPGMLQCISLGENGTPEGSQLSWQGHTEIPADSAADLFCLGMELTCAERNGAAEVEAAMTMATFHGRGIRAVQGVSLGEPEAQTHRPSLILRRKEDSLWETAKVCRSTVEAILQANGLSQEPEAGTLLLIPVV